jgi:hypothetical protein
MTARQRVYLAGGAFVLAGGYLAFLWRNHALAALAAAAPGIAPSPAPYLGDFPAGSSVTDFQPIITGPSAAIPNQTTGGATSYVPLFGFLARGGYGESGFASSGSG